MASNKQSRRFSKLPDFQAVTLASCGIVLLSQAQRACLGLLSHLDALGVVIRQCVSFVVMVFSQTNAAFTAFTLTFLRVDNQISARQGVSVLAMRLLCVYRTWAGSSQNINLRRNFFEMDGVNAMRHSTQMVNDIFTRGGGYEQRVHQPMDGVHEPIDIKAPIPAPPSFCRPLPAGLALIKKTGRHFNLAKDTSKYYLRNWGECFTRGFHISMLIKQGAYGK
jgi:hypothetical protein